MNWALFAIGTLTTSLIGIISFMWITLSKKVDGSVQALVCDVKHNLLQNQLEDIVETQRKIYDRIETILIKLGEINGRTQ